MGHWFTNWLSIWSHSSPRFLSRMLINLMFFSYFRIIFFCLQPGWAQHQLTVFFLTEGFFATHSSWDVRSVSAVFWRGRSIVYNVERWLCRLVRSTVPYCIINLFQCILRLLFFISNSIAAAGPQWLAAASAWASRSSHYHWRMRNCICRPISSRSFCTVFSAYY